MGEQVLIAKRINNGQSVIWLEAEPDNHRLVATNCIVYPVRTLCSAEESETFHKIFAESPAIIPQTIVDKLIEDFRVGT